MAVAQTNSAPQYNGYLVFDYLDGSNYKYAGMDGTNGQWVIREVISGTDTLRASVAGTIVKGTLYELEVQVSGSLATLKVGGVVKTSYTFGGIHGGQVGLRIDQAHTHFKEVYLRAFSQVTKYYTFGGQRIAMRRDHVLYFLAADHLGTVSVVLDAAGNKVDEIRHYPYGTERWPVDGTFPTEYRFTGQLLDGYTSLYFMGARQYDPQLGRWISPDTMVPDPSNPQSLNRYSYVLGNPLRYLDRTGHWDEEWAQRFEQEHGHTPTDQDWWDYQFSLQVVDFAAWGWDASFLVRSDLFSAAVTITSDGVGWLRRQAEQLHSGVMALVRAMGGHAKYRKAVGSIVFRRVNYDLTFLCGARICARSMAYNPQTGTIDVLNLPRLGDAARDIGAADTLHELAHAWDRNSGYWLSYLARGSGDPQPWEAWARWVSFHLTGLGDPRGLVGYSQGIVAFALRHPNSPVLWLFYDLLVD